MKALTSLLERISASLGRDTVAKDSVIGCMQEILGFTLPAKDVFINGSTLEITASPVKKSAIRLEEDRILRELKSRHNISIARIFYK